jgi:hypothetical protein
MDGDPIAEEESRWREKYMIAVAIKMSRVKRILFCCAPSLSFLYLYEPVAAAAGNPSVDSTLQVISGSSPVAITFILSVLVLKVTAFVLGYLIVKLGHDTMIKGITGQIDFGFSGGGVKAKLKSGSPGAFFVLAGAAIIIWGLLVQKPMDIKYTPPPEQKVEQKVETKVPAKVIPVPN